MYYSNVQSLCANLPKIEQVVAETQPDIIFLSETRITADMYQGEFCIDNYVVYTSVSPSRHSGGVCVYVKSSISSSLVYEYSYGYCNFLIVDVLEGDLRGRYMCTYRSPASSAADFTNKLEEICNLYNSSSFTIVGDVNINVHRSVNSAEKSVFLRKMSTQGLIQKVKSFTRIYGDSKSLIDVCCTNNQCFKVQVVKNDQIADHKAILITKKVTYKTRSFKVIMDRSAYSRERMLRQFDDVFDKDVFASQDLHEKCFYFEENVKNSVNFFVKRKTVDVDYSKKWFDANLHEIRALRNRAGLRAEFDPSVENWAEYRRARNRYNKQIKRCKNDFIMSTINENIDDPKKLWREIKRYENGNDVKIAHVVHEGLRFDAAREIAQVFNDFFVDSIVRITDDIEDMPYCSLIDTRIVSEWTDFTELSYPKMKKLLKDIKTKSGIDNVNARVLGDVTDRFASELLSIINESLREGLCPEFWRRTTVTPIRKVAGTHEVANFRAVNNISVGDKIIQKFVKERLEMHLRINNILVENQSAFRQHHSCESAFNLLLNDWKLEVEAGNKVVCVFLDLKRAFETVDRKILLDKMKEYGISGNAHNWFKSWLENRQQCTVFNGEKSSFRQINVGVPQGTPLSCILFLLYINCIVKCLTHCKINLFADDAVIWISGKDMNELLAMLNTELDRVYEYLCKNKLKLNIQKTKCMVIGGRQTDEIDVIINGEKLDVVDKIKYLGVMVDKKLRFRDNTDFVLKKMTKKINWLRRMRNKFDQKTKLLVLKSLIMPHIDYCSTVLFLMCNEEIQLLQKAQNMALRAILKEGPLARTDDMLTRLELMSVKQRIHFNVLVILYKARVGLLPDYMCRNLTEVQSVQVYPLRSNHLYRLPNLFTASARNSLFHKGVNIFNDFLKRNQLTNDLGKDKTLITQYVMQYIERR